MDNGVPIKRTESDAFATFTGVERRAAVVFLADVVVFVIIGVADFALDAITDAVETRAGVIAGVADDVFAEPATLN